MVTTFPAFWVVPPARVIASKSRCWPSNGYTPGFCTSPSTDTPSATYSLTKMETCGLFEEFTFRKFSRNQILCLRQSESRYMLVPYHGQHDIAGSADSDLFLVEIGRAIHAQFEQVAGANGHVGGGTLRLRSGIRR